MITAKKISKTEHGRSTLVIILVLLLLAGLPVAAWLDMRSLSDNILARQSDEISRVINDMLAVVAKYGTPEAAARTLDLGPAVLATRSKCPTAARVCPLARACSPCL